MFGTGYSSGAFFINQLACRDSSFFHAIAPHAGGAPNEPNDPAAGQWKPYYTKCAGQTSGVPAIVFHGTADTTVSVDSGDFTAKYWAYVNGCDEDHREATDPSPCMKHDACPVQRPVVYCEIPGLGHVVWSEGAKTAWAFFQSL